MAKHRYLVSPKEFFSPHGRINRLQYLLNGWGCNILIFLIAFAADFLTNSLPEDLADTLESPISWLVMVLTVLIFYALFCMVAKRLHDLNVTAWLGLILFAGIAPDLIATFGGTFVEDNEMIIDGLDIVSKVGYVGAMALGLVLTFWPGKPGDNRFGPSPNDYELPKAKLLED